MLANIHKHTRQTIAFFVIGLVISGITAFVLVSLHNLISLVFNNCILVWQALWVVCGLLALMGPGVYLRKFHANETLSSYWLFLLVEYLLFQGAFTPLYTDTKLMCYSQGGQNALEMAFAAWTGYLPLLIIGIYIDRKTYGGEEETEDDE